MVVTARRDFLAAIGALALAGCAQGTATSAQLARFMQASRTLTGYADLDAAAGRVYLAALRANPVHARALEALYADPDFGRGARIADPAARAIATQILDAWYSGIYVGPNGPKTQTWTQALAWRACAYTKPPSECAAPGSWAARPT